MATEDLSGRAPRVRGRIHFRIPPLGFFRPKPSVLRFGEVLQALEQLPGQTSPRFRIESQRFSLEFLNTHGGILHQTGLLKHGEPAPRRAWPGLAITHLACSSLLLPPASLGRGRPG